MTGHIEKINQIVEETTISVPREAIRAAIPFSSTIRQTFRDYYDAVDVHFFTILILKEHAERLSKDLMYNLSRSDIPRMNGLTYVELGEILGKQDAALRLMALGEYFGFWRIAHPKRIMPDLDMSHWDSLANQGMVWIDTSRFPKLPVPVLIAVLELIHLPPLVWREDFNDHLIGWSFVVHSLVSSQINRIHSPRSYCKRRALYRDCK
ncbi:hypothetical protein ACP26L_12300 [Paenibacillus sp. S-38]|uniref:hypothetical protein n=1 Tax=Paenibacillus sp. S-38 TaxID=3416710 RepID=UPI003CEA87B1